MQMAYLRSLLILTCGFVPALQGAMNRNPGQNQAQAVTQEVREVRSSVERLRYELIDIDEQMNVFSEKFKTQEAIVEALSKELEKEKLALKDTVKVSQSQFEQKLSKIEKLLKSVAEDIHTLQTHANQVSQSVAESQRKIEALDVHSQHHAEDLDNMKSALMAVMEAVQVTTPSLGSKVYHVKSGDTLGEIAMRHKTTAKMLKDLNHLKDDKIKIGQVLKLPQ